MFIKRNKFYKVTFIMASIYFIYQIIFYFPSQYWFFDKAYVFYPKNIQEKKTHGRLADSSVLSFIFSKNLYIDFTDDGYKGITDGAHIIFSTKKAMRKLISLCGKINCLEEEITFIGKAQDLGEGLWVFYLKDIEPTE